MLPFFCPSNINLHTYFHVSTRERQRIGIAYINCIRFIPNFLMYLQHACASPHTSKRVGQLPQECVKMESCSCVVWTGRRLADKRLADGILQLDICKREAGRRLADIKNHLNSNMPGNDDEQGHSDDTYQ